MSNLVKIGAVRVRATGSSTFGKRSAGRRVAWHKAYVQQRDTLPVVLTVVGTMKAGKSACINAIIGREILPSRNRPMTAIPTLVRHKVGVKVPVLLFPETTPVQQLVDKLRRAIDRSSAIRIQRIESDAELVRVANKILRGFTVKPCYRGDAAVLSFLRTLNDLARLADIYQIAFPFEQYTALDQFPLIEVEFANLDSRDDLGESLNLALLDTPGFNESRDTPHLRTLFQERLQHADAVLVVLDYTQLKSEAEAELISELKEISCHAEGRMFALVNKFDREDANSDNAEATVHYVAQKLLHDVVPATRIFPVSAQHAYLAQRARLAIKHGARKNGGLAWKDGRVPDWRDDFGKLVFGRRYGPSLNDSESVNDGIAQLWDASRFVAPLCDIIHFSRLRAMELARRAFLEQLHLLSEQLDDSD